MMPNKTRHDNPLPALSRRDFPDYNPHPHPRCGAALPVAGACARRYAKKMKFAFTLLLATSFWGCSRSEIERADLADQFEEEINRHEEIVFIDSSNLGASMDGSILSLHFFPDSKIHLYTWGNGFSNSPGTYAFTENNGIELIFDDQSWPRLRLLNEGDLFILDRQDGLKSLTKSYIHTDQNGVRTKIDDADIYPEARPLIFPLTQRIATAEQDAADQLPARAESETE
jgi:hypothetical protein